MKVSIIVPCYKVENFLCTCIESILQQSYIKWELILVNDGSPDRSGEICDEYARIDDRIKVIHKENGGLSSARNAGLDIMTGEYVTFLDSDDFWHKDYLEVLMFFVKKNYADIVQCGFVRGTESVFPKIDIQLKNESFDNHSVFIKQVANIVMWGKVFKAAFFDDIRMPIGLINEDDWVTWKLYYKASKIMITNQPLYYYTQNPNSIMGVKNKKPDISYFGAYEERINFFIEKGEKELEDASRIQFCKSLLLLYSNVMLTVDEKTRVKALFDENWNKILSSHIISKKLKIIFFSFYNFPLVTSKIVVKKRMR
jgi:glycosyltransferase involved in cell wall biosynthesis